jgi:hypothetical protein
MASKAVAARPEPLPETAAAQRLGRLGAPTVQIAYRVAGIEVRKAFTDALKRFSEYVDEGGNASSGGRGIYIHLSRRINTTFGLSRKIAEEFLGGGTEALRDLCSIMELLALQMLEIDLRDRLEAGMTTSESRDDIKKALYAIIDTYGDRFGDRFTRWRVKK